MKVYILMQVVQESADYEASYLDSVYADYDSASKAQAVAFKLNLDKNTHYEVEVHEVEG